MKKLVSLFLAVMMVLAMGSAMTATAEEPVNLVWWLFATAEAPEDQAEVEAAMNELSLAELGITCTYVYMTDDQISRAISTGEYFDICFTCDWYNDFQTNVSNGMFLDITDLIDEYCAEMKATMLDNIWSGAYINDRLYAIPHMKDYGIEVFWILDSNYFLEEKGLEVDQYISFEEIDEYAAMYKEDYPDRYPMYTDRGGLTSWTNFMDWIYEDALIALSYDAQGTEDETKVQFALEMPEFVERMYTIRSFYEKGYINPDAAVTETLGRPQKGVIQSGQGWFGAETVWANARQAPVYISRFDGPYLSTYSLRGAMTAVSATTPYAAEALQLINFMNTNEEYRTLARYGIEGKHYTRNEDGTVTRTEEGMQKYNPNTYTHGSYVVGPLEASPFPEVPTDTEQWQKTWAGYEDAITSAAIGFGFDYMTVEAQCMAISDIWQSYLYEIQTGTADLDVVLPEIIAQMEEAGIRDVVAEAQRQLDEFLGK